MKLFISKVLFFLMLIGVSVGFLFSRADGNLDPFYVRFTTQKQNSLILGSSRAAQGLQPSVFKKSMGLDIFNYAFTLGHSPYGAVYLESVKRKLDPSSRNATFILTVDPWSISSMTTDPNDSAQFREANLCLANTKYVNLNPNPQYILNNLGGNYHKLIWQSSVPMFLHNDGWLEVNLKIDSVSLKQRRAKKLKMYREKILPYYQFSDVRLAYLIKTIKYLDTYGKVYLLRLPVHPEMMALDRKLMPDFNTRILEAVSLSGGYLDLTSRNSEFVYTDGNHLSEKSGKEVSEIVAGWLTDPPIVKIEAENSQKVNSL